MRKQQKFILILPFILVSVAPALTLSIEAPPHLTPFKPIETALHIQRQLEKTTKLPQPLLDITYDYYTYTVTTITLFDKKLVPHARENPPHNYPIASIINIKLHGNYDEELHVLEMVLSNRRHLALALPDGEIVRSEENYPIPYELFQQKAITDDARQIVGYTCIVAQSLINDHDSQGLYSVRVDDPERGRPELITDSFDDVRMRQRWHAGDERYSREDWLAGQDQRRTKIGVMLNVKEIIAELRRRKIYV